mmetsp:Transcript_1875/g.2300  ORF Transcript_1875/g.2300 Transcript_1875/m.2300 type:complete len:266 (+) Transcript_1875:65-862(+)|eukprot:jgi/Bigna1/67952/fgenesh1_pg.5_\
MSQEHRRLERIAREKWIKTSKGKGKNTSEDLLVDDKHSLIEGPLLKLSDGLAGSGVHRQFRKRWVRLVSGMKRNISDGPALFYFANPNEKPTVQTPIRRLLSLWNFSKVTIDQKNISKRNSSFAKKYNYVFEIDVGRGESNESFVFACGSQKERDRWVDAIEAAIHPNSKSIRQQQIEKKHEKIEVTIKSLIGSGEMYTFHVPANSTVMDLKKEICMKSGDLNAKMSLRYAGRNLENNHESLDESGILGGSVIHLTAMAQGSGID